MSLRRLCSVELFPQSPSTIDFLVPWGVYFLLGCHMMWHASMHACMHACFLANPRQGLEVAHTKLCAQPGLPAAHCNTSSQQQLLLIACFHL